MVGEWVKYWLQNFCIHRSAWWMDHSPGCQCPAAARAAGYVCNFLLFSKLATRAWPSKLRNLAWFPDSKKRWMSHERNICSYCAKFLCKLITVLYSLIAWYSVLQNFWHNPYVWIISRIERERLSDSCVCRSEKCSRWLDSVRRKRTNWPQRG